MVDVESAFDTVAGLTILASVIVAFIEAGSGIGSISDLLTKAMGQPTSFGLGLVIFFFGFDSLVPAIPVSFLPSYLQWLGVFYPHMTGYIPHFSMWTLLFASIMTIIVTLLTMYIWDLDFWFKGLGIAFVTFIIGWYAWTLIAWQLMFTGASMIGLSYEATYNLWHASVSTTQSNWLQYFFLFSLPITGIYIGRKVASII